MNHTHQTDFCCHWRLHIYCQLIIGSGFGFGILIGEIFGCLFGMCKREMDVLVLIGTIERKKNVNAMDLIVLL